MSCIWSPITSRWSSPGFLFTIGVLSLVFLHPLSVIAQPTEAQPDPLVLSWRVGTDIDMLEREYFGLFPKVESFAGAVAHADGDSVVFTIACSPLPDLHVRLTRAAFAELGRYVDNMERVRAGSMPIDWTLAPAITSSNPYADGRTVTVQRVGGVDVTGRLATIDERGLTIWTGDGHYVPERVRSDVVVVPFAQLERLQSGFMHWIGLATGASLFGAISGYVFTMGHEPSIPIGMVFATTTVGGLVGIAGGSFLNVNVQYAGSTIRYEELTALSGKQMYYTVAPPELRAYADSVFDSDRTVRIAAAVAQPALLGDSRHRPVKTLGLTLGCAIGPSRSLGTEGYTVTKSFNRSEPGVYILGAYAVRAEASYDILPWLAIGAGYSQRGGVRSDTTDNSEWSQVKEPLAYLEFNPLPPQEYRRRVVEPMVAIGGGYMLADYTAQLPSASGAQRRLFESDHKLPMVLGRAALAINSMTRLAFVFGIEARFVRSFTIPMYEFRHDPRPEYRYKWVEEHDVNLSTVEMQIGVRFRI